MRKFTALLLTAALLLSCTACSSAKDTVTATPEPIETPAPTEAPTEAEPAAETIVIDDVPVHVTSEDGLVELDLPNQRWAEIHSDEHKILFSDGDCAIAIDLYKSTDKLPSIAFSDNMHKLIFTSTLSANDYVLFITGYAHEETDFSAMSTSINSIRIDSSKVPQTVAATPAPSYTIQDCNYSAWVTATGLNVRSASGTNAKVVGYLTQDTQITVTGEVLSGSRYIGWSRITTPNGTVGYVASQFLTTTQPKPKPTRTGTTKKLWSQYGSVYIVYEYTDNTWKTDDGTTYWPYGFSTWTNSASKLLYDYDPTEPVANPTKTGANKQLWDDGGGSVLAYEYTDTTWRDDNGVTYWPDTFSLWKSSNNRFYYDYDPLIYPAKGVTDVPTPPANWKAQFEGSLSAHDGMIPSWYSYLGNGYYEAHCQDPDNPDVYGTAQVNAYTGEWNWV